MFCRKYGNHHAGPRLLNLSDVTHNSLDFFGPPRLARHLSLYRIRLNIKGCGLLLRLVLPPIFQMLQKTHE